MNLSGFLNYVYWADSRALEMLRRTPAVEPKALALFSHILAEENLWLCRLQGKTPDMSIWPEIGLEESERLLEINLAGFRDLLRSFGDAELSRIVEYRTSKGLDYKTSVFDILVQVLNHGTYHRGQIAQAVSRCGGEVIDTDYITYVREIH
jgi:uncharacterized damage-inducible protein DinB